MPNWAKLLEEGHAAGSTHDIVSRKYLTKLHKLTGRNIIVYYSGWLQKGQLAGKGIRFDLNDEDKNGFMTTIAGMDRSKGLDLMLHTPGGEMAATESLVDYLRSMFNTDIRAIIPQLAMSAGTMIALACKEIIMGKQSSLGPVDPQLGGVPAKGISEEFNRAREEIKKDPRLIPVWQPILAKYSPTIIGECERAFEWAREMVKEWLKTGMFLDDPEAEDKANKAILELTEQAFTKSHNRHISMGHARDMVGLHITALEEDPRLQEAVLTVHHACIQTLTSTGATKIIQNHKGGAFILNVAAVPVARQ